MKYLPTLKALKKTIAAAFFLIMVSANSFSQGSLFTFQYPPVLIPQSLYSNMDSVSIPLNVFDVDPSGGVTNIYANTVSLTDTNFFMYLGSVVFDSTDSVSSTMYGYRFKFNGYGTVPTGDVAFISISVNYMGEQVEDWSSLYNSCLPNVTCPSHLYMGIMYGALFSSLPFSGYDNQYDSLQPYNQQVVATVLNWIFNNNTPTVSDYLSMANPNNEWLAQTPSAFCTSSTGPGTCAGQKELYDTLQSICNALVANGPNDSTGFQTISSQAQNTFTLHCFMSNLYSPALFSSPDGNAYSIVLMSHSAEFPTLVSGVLFNNDTAYTTTVYSYNTSPEFAITGFSGGAFTHGSGWLVANGDSAFTAFPFSKPTVTANGATSFCTGDSVVLSSSDTVNHIHWSTGDTLRTISATVSGNYTLTVINAEGCSVKADTVVVVHTTPTAITPFTQKDTICPGTPVYIRLAHSEVGVRYDLKMGDSVMASGYGNGDTLILNTGNVNSSAAFSVLATDTTVSCSFVLTPPVTITVSAPDTIYTSHNCTFYVNPVPPTANINLWVSGSYTPYSFLWSNADTAQNPQNLSNSTYTVTVTNAYGCTSSASVDINCTPACSMDSLSITCNKCVMGQSDGMRLWNLNYNYSGSNGSHITISGVQSQIFFTFNTNVKNGVNNTKIYAGISNSITALTDTLLVTITDSLTGGTCSQNIIASLVCDSLVMFDSLTSCTPGLYSVSIDSVFPDGVDQYGNLKFMAPLSFQNYSQDTIIADSIGCIPCSDYSTVNHGPGIYAPGVTADTLWFSLADSSSQQVSLTFLTIGNCSVCSITGSHSLPLSTPIFTIGDTIICSSTVACYHAVAVGSMQMRYSIASGTTTVDSISGCVSTATGNFTIRATAMNTFRYTTTAYQSVTMPLFNASVTPADTAIWIGQSVQLVAHGGSSYSWTGLGSTDSSVTVIPTADSTWYSVIASNSTGCTDSVIALVLTANGPVHLDSVDMTVSCPGIPALIACSNNTFALSLVNNTGRTQSFTLNIGFSNAATAANFNLTPHSGDTLVRHSGSDSVSLHISLDGTHNSTHPDTIFYRVYIPCSLIPDTLTGGVVYFNQYFRVSGGSGIDVNGYNPSSLSCQLTFPYISNLVPNSISQYIGYQQADTFTVSYKNSGTADFNGRLSFSGDESPCAHYLKITGLIFKTFNVNGSLLDSIHQNGPVTFPFIPSAALVIPKGGSLSISEIIQDTSCLPANGCPSFFKLNWGCSDTDICQRVTDSIPVVVNQSTAGPFLVISRIEPAADPIGGNGNGYAWDGSCINTPTEWEFLIYNGAATGGEVADSLFVNLFNTDTNSFTFIDQSTVSIDTLMDSLFGLQPPVFPQADVFAAHHFHSPAPSCSSNVPNAIDSFSIGPLIDSTHHFQLRPGQGFVLRFSTYRCCPDSVDYAQAMAKGYDFNRWNLQVNSRDKCGNYFYATTGQVGYDSGHQHTYLSNLTGGAISTNQYDNGPDLSLFQLFDQNTFDMSGSNHGCGKPQNFQIKNMLFTGNTLAISDFDTQLFCDSGTAGGPAGVTGLHPKGIIRVQFVCPANLHVPQNANSFPVITAFDTVWKPVAWSFSTTLCTADFDIQQGWFNQLDSALPPPNTSADFRQFFQHPSSINFQLQVCCPVSDSFTQSVLVNTLFNPRPNSGCDTNCFIKLFQLPIPVQLHCPGCITPGIIIDNFDLVRTTFGFEDQNDDGLPEIGSGTLVHIDTANYLPYDHGGVLNQLNMHGSIAGDTLEAITDAHFQDGDSTAFGFTYSQWTSYWDTLLDHLYLEQKLTDVVGLGLSAIGAGTLIYTDSVANTTHVYSLSLAPVITTLTDGSADYLYHVQLSALSPPVQAGIGDRFLFKMGYTTCINPDTISSIVSDNEMFLMSNAAYIPRPYTTDIPLPQFYENDSTQIHSGGDTIQNAKVVPPGDSVLWLCEAHSGRHKVYPVHTTFVNSITDSLSCYKPGIAEVRYFIDAGIENIFQYEYRMVPRISLSDLNDGPDLVNPFSRVKMHLNVPANYTVQIDEMYTKAPDYRTGTHNPIISTVGTLAVLPNTFNPIAGYAQINFTSNDTLVDYTPPYTLPVTYDSALTGMNIFPGSPAPEQAFNNSTNSRGALVLGDESFTQGIKYRLTPICRADTGIVTVKDTDVYALIPDCSNACITDTDNWKIYQPGADFSLTIPRIPLSAAIIYPPVFDSNTITYQVNLNVPAGMASNVIFYLDIQHPPLASGINLTRISDAYNHIIIPALVRDTVAGILDSFNRYDLGALRAGTQFPYYLTFTVSNCQELDTSTLVRIYYNWDCDKKTQDSLPPDTTLCSTPQFVTLTVTPPAVGITVQNYAFNESQVATCSAPSFIWYLYSTDLGGIGNIVDTLFLPASIIMPMRFPVILAGHTCDILADTLHTILYGQPYIVYILHLDTITSFDALGNSCSSSLVGTNGLNSLNSPLRIGIQASTIKCNTDSLAPMWYNFSGIRYCGLTAYHLHDTCNLCTFTTQNAYFNTVINGHPQSIYLKNGCIVPHLKELCNGDLTVDNIYTLNNINRTFTYFWNGDTIPGTDTLAYANALPGADTVRVENVTGCPLGMAADSIHHPLSVADSITNTSCTGGASGSITLVTDSNGARPYHYNWSNGDSTAIITGLGMGTYTVIVTDTLHCADTLHLTVNGISTSCCFTDTVTNLIEILQDTLSSKLTIPPGSSVYIAAGVTLTVDSTLILQQCEIVLGANAKIIVNAGDSLKILGSTLKGCDTLWNGIEVNDTSVVITDQYSGDTSVIKDALYGINNSANGKVYVTNTKFYCNLIGVYFNGYYAGSNAGYQVSDCYFGMGGFTTVLPAPVVWSLPYLSRPIAGLLIQNGGPLTIPNTSLPDSGANTFDNMNCGIFCLGTALNIYSNYFRNMHNYDTALHNQPEAGCAVYFHGDGAKGLVMKTNPAAPDTNTAINFLNCDYGLNALSANGLLAYNNRMDSVTNGIYSAICLGSVTVEHNYINHTNFGVSLMANTGAKQKVDNNTIFVNDPYIYWSVVYINFGGVHFVLRQELHRDTYGIRENEFNNSVADSCTIDSNNITDGRVCIWLTNADSTKVFENTMNQTSTTSIDGVAAGLLATNCKKLQIVYNRFYGNAGVYNDTVSLLTPTPYRKIGMQIENSGGVIACNTLGGTTTQTGLGYGMRYVGNCPNTYLLSNYMYLSKYGLVLQAAGSTPAIGDQGSSNEDFANQFYGDGSSSHYFNNPNHYRTFTFVDTTYYNPPLFWYLGAGSVTNPEVTDPSGSNPAGFEVLARLVFNSSHTVYGCLPAPVFRLRPYDGRVAQDSAAYLMEPGYETTGKWVAEKMLYEELQEDTALLNSDSIFQAFYTAKSAEDIGAIAQYQDTLKAMANSAVLSDSVALNQKISSAHTLLAAISITNKQAANYVGVNYIYLKIMQYGLDSLTQTEVEGLDYMATRCPYSEGDAVYIARSIMGMIDNSIYYDEVESCPETDTRMLRVPNSSGANADTNIVYTEFVNLYPNPANDLLNLVYFVKAVGPLKFELVNQLGEIVKLEKVPEGINFVTYSTTAIGNGVYSWRLKDSERVIKAGKIVIIK